MFGYPVLRSKPQRWIPELRFGYPPLRNFPKSFWEKHRFFLERSGETDFLHLLVLMRGGAAPVKTSTGNDFPRKYQGFPHKSITSTVAKLWWRFCPSIAISAATYRGAKCPTLKTAKKTAEKGAEWVTVKQPKNSRKNSRNTRKTAEKQSKQLFFRVFRLFFRLFFGCFTVTHSAPFSAVFSAVFNVGHLARDSCPSMLYWAPRKGGASAPALYKNPAVTEPQTSSRSLRLSLD